MRIAGYLGDDVPGGGALAYLGRCGAVGSYQGPAGVGRVVGLEVGAGSVEQVRGAVFDR
ncbi:MULTISPECIES: hypothetical protein [unclassified Micromonospora]|uniref:hypothetical protein n=1 Tax=unclassified Micromonospora TaxID=2617518 RepID=UPI0036304A3B